MRGAVWGPARAGVRVRIAGGAGVGGKGGKDGRSADWGAAQRTRVPAVRSAKRNAKNPAAPLRYAAA